MLEGKDYISLNIFPFIAGYLDRLRGLTHEASLTKVYTIESDLPRRVREFRRNGESSSPCLTGLREFLKEMSDKNCKRDLYTIQLPLLDHVAEYVSRLETLEKQCVWQSKRCKRHIKLA